MERTIKKYETMLSSLTQSGNCRIEVMGLCDDCALHKRCSAALRECNDMSGEQYRKTKTEFLKNEVNRIKVLQSWKTL